MDTIKELPNISEFYNQKFIIPDNIEKYKVKKKPWSFENYIQDSYTKIKSSCLNNKSFQESNTEELDKNYNKRYKKGRFYKCIYCYTEFTIKKSFVKHLRLHRKNNSSLFECKNCTKYFTNIHALNKHILIDECSKMMKRSICHKIFDDINDFLNHYELHKCDYSFRNFVTEEECFDHSKKCKKQKLYKCELCDRMFKFEINYTKHLKSFYHQMNVNNQEYFSRKELNPYTYEFNLNE